MSFETQDPLRLFYLKGSEEVDIFQNSEDKYEVPGEIFNEDVIFMKQPGGGIRPLEPEDIEKELHINRIR